LGATTNTNFGIGSFFKTEQTSHTPTQSDKKVEVTTQQVMVHYASTLHDTVTSSIFADIMEKANANVGDIHIPFAIPVEKCCNSFTAATHYRHVVIAYPVSVTSKATLYTKPP